MIYILRKDLKEYCLNFIKDSLDICQNDSSKFQLEEEDDYYPKFLNKKFDDIIQKKIKNYEEFIYKNEKQICSTKSFELLNSFISEQESIKLFFQDFHKKHSGNKTKNVEEDTQELILVFLVNYLEKNMKFNFTQKTFDDVFKDFFEFLNNKIHSIDYFTPLYNFESNKDTFHFGNILLRRITEYEFKIVSRLGIGPGQINSINPDYVNLQFILEITIPRKNNSNEEDTEARNQFSKLSQAMKLLFSGDVIIGASYRNYSNSWSRIWRYINGNEPDFFSNNRLNLTPKSYKDLCSFYENFKKIDLTKKEFKFLKMSVQRFESATLKKQVEDKIVDFMISLESLYTSGPGETRMKMANRISALLGDSDDEKETLWHFINSAYNIRSGIVHGDGIRSKEIMGKEFSLEEISSRLEEITRISIRRILSLIKFYEGNRINEKIVDEIDVGLINRKKLLELQKNAKEMTLKN